MHQIEQIFINGEFVTPHGTEWFDLYNPATAQVIGQVRLADEVDAGRAIAAAKAAESLLSIKGVDAAFALIRIGGETHISARSTAAVSVQLILEKMGGGGHLDSAGARSADPMLTVLEQLKAAIDAYLEENNSQTSTDI